MLLFCWEKSELSVSVTAEDVMNHASSSGCKTAATPVPVLVAFGEMWHEYFMLTVGCLVCVFGSLCVFSVSGFISMHETERSPFKAPAQVSANQMASRC